MLLVKSNKISFYVQRYFSLPSTLAKETGAFISSVLQGFSHFSPQKEPISAFFLSLPSLLAVISVLICLKSFL